MKTKKRYFRFLLGLALVLFLTLCSMPYAPCGVAFADWSVTATWTRSVGPNLAKEDVLLSGVSKCSITPPAATSCQFTVTTLTGQPVVVRSYNAQGAYADTAPILLNAVPAPATGVLVNITYVSP